MSTSGQRKLNKFLRTENVSNKKYVLAMCVNIRVNDKSSIYTPAKSVPVEVWLCGIVALCVVFVVVVVLFMPIYLWSQKRAKELRFQN